MTFELATAGRVLVGRGTAAQLAPSVAALGARVVLVVTGKSAARAAPFVEALQKEGMTAVPFAVSDEPTVVIYGEFGVRLEDCFHMTEAGPVLFTQLSPAVDRPFA